MRRTSRWTSALILMTVALGVAAFGVRGRVVAGVRRALSAIQTRTMAPASNEAPASGKSLTPAADGGGATARAEVTIDPRRQQLIGVRTVVARRAALAETIRTVGIVRYDETSLADVNVKVEGWIRDLYVDYTGRAVAKGQPLFTLYSPDVLNTENEYLLALKTRDQMQQSPLSDARERAEALVAASRQRLALWDLTPEQIRVLEDTRMPETAVMFRSPVDGVVIDKQALKGGHVVAGQSLYKIADLSLVWIEADLYEREIPLVKIGGRAVVTLDAYPGERLSGSVIYVYPFVDEKTRTTKVRYAFPNRDGRLKPGMYANVEIAAPAGAGVIVPTNAVLDSGKEQVVFVAEAEGVFQPRRVRTGRRLGADIQILEGIREGETVATGATFFLDSESQLRASLQGYEAPPATAAGATSSQQLDITLRSQPDPPKSGENQFEVMVKDAGGKAVDGAQVSVEFFMAAMPTMNMPAMRSEVKLVPAGGGTYRGSGQVMTAGRWDVTVTVSRGGQRVGSRQLAVVAR